MKLKYHFCVIVLYFASLWRSAGGAENNTWQNKTAYPQPCKEKTGSVKADIFIVLLILIFIVGLIGNTAAIATITFSKRLRAMPTNIFVVALALCDIGAILFIIPIRLDMYLYERNFCFDIHVCRMFNLCDVLFHVGSISHLFLIALERYFAVNYPFFYQRIISIEKTMLGILLTWIYAAFWACLSLFNWEHPSQPTSYILASQGKRFCLLNNRVFFNVSNIVVYIIPLIVMGIIYSTILRVALKQARIIESLSINQDQSESKKHRREVHATKTLAIVYGAFTFCWLPLVIIAITSKWFPESYKSFRIAQPILFDVIFSLFVEVLPTFNSCLNPFLYILFNKKFRQEMTMLWYKIRNSTPTISISSDSSAMNSTNPSNNRAKYFKEHSKAYETNNLGESSNSVKFYKRFNRLSSGAVSPATSSQTQL